MAEWPFFEQLGKGCRGIGNDQIVCVGWRQFAGIALTQELIERGLNSFFCGLGPAVTHPSMLKLCANDIDTVGLGLLGRGENAGIGFEVWVL